MKNILFVLHDSNIDSGATKSLMDIVDKLNKSYRFIYKQIFNHERATIMNHRI